MGEVWNLLNGVADRHDTAADAVRRASMVVPNCGDKHHGWFVSGVRGEVKLLKSSWVSGGHVGLVRAALLSI